MNHIMIGTAQNKLVKISIIIFASLLILLSILLFYYKKLVVKPSGNYVEFASMNVIKVGKELLDNDLSDITRQSFLMMYSAFGKIQAM